jgi:SAM-dependent methyltransferase
MTEQLAAALDEVRGLILDPEGLVRAVAAGRRRGSTPTPVRAELRPVDLKQGRQLQLIASDGQRPSTRNLPFGRAAEDLVDGLLAEPFGNWHVETTRTTLQLRVTKRGEAQVHRAAAVTGAEPDGAHDRAKVHLLAPDDPLYDVVGGNAAKRRQVDAFLRALAATLDGPVPEPLRVVDLGCGNAYLTFAALRYLTARGHDVHITGVDVRDDQRERNTALAERLGYADRVSFVTGSIAAADVDGEPDLVLALHACDTATDEAIQFALCHDAKFVALVPCCQAEVASALESVNGPLEQLWRHPIQRREFGAHLTNVLRGLYLEAHGYKVRVTEFTGFEHTQKNEMIFAERHQRSNPRARAEFEKLKQEIGTGPALLSL